MIRRHVVLSPEASADLEVLYDWIAEQASPDIALGYVERLEAHTRKLAIGAERGTLHSEIRNGLRTVGFERRVTIAFTTTADTVIVLGFFYGGRDWQAVLGARS